MLKNLFRQGRSSLVACRHLSSSEVKSNFTKQRAQYEEELARLRSAWGAQIKAEREEEEIRKRTEREKVIFRKAMKLRESRKMQEIKTEEAKKRQEADQARYLAKLEKTQALFREKKLTTQKRLAAAKSAHEEEAHHYITPENIDKVLTEEFFDARPKTTGLTFAHSKYWNYVTKTVSLTRYRTDTELREATEVGHPHDEAKLRKDVGNYLNQMIGSGDDRAKFEDHVQRVVNNYPSPFGGKIAKTPIYDDYLQRYGAKLGKRKISVADRNVAKN